MVSGIATCCRKVEQVPEASATTVMGVINRFVDRYWHRYGKNLGFRKRKALQAILQCRTEVMGGHRYQCGSCELVHFAWHSCNNRLCPQCGKADTAKWVDRQLCRLLPVPYFMVTFTLPAQLRGAIANNDVVLRAFISACAQALEEILADPKHAGFFKSGFMGVYQSWRQDMLRHPHTHWIVPAVGLDAQGKLVKLKKFDYLVHAKVLARRMKTILLMSLEELECISPSLLLELWSIDWNADVRPIGSGENAVKYLGQYFSRSVISDNRIIKVDEDSVWIRVKNRDNGTYYPVRIDGVEFINRLLMHVLPPGFHRVRYRGFLHPRGRPNLHWLQVLLAAKIRKPSSFYDSCQTMTCPRCGAESYRDKKYARAPPMRRHRQFVERMTR